IVNRIGDFAFICGFSLLYWALVRRGFHTLSFTEIRDHVDAIRLLPGPFGMSLIALVTFLFFFGATGKSAQIPLYVWLPDAMAGPTSVSALIHAATMVTAGVYMVARTHTIFDLSQTAQTVVMGIGIATVLLAGLIAIVQDDIKKVLAYSTVSQ